MTGGTGKATKRYYMQAWSDGPASEFRHLRLTVLVATSCGATGIDSKWCAAVVRSGPPGSPIDLLQERGRIRAQGTEYPYEYHVVLTLSTWASLLQRISQIPSHYRAIPIDAKRAVKREQVRQEASLRDLMKSLVLKIELIYKMPIYG